MKRPCVLIADDEPEIRSLMCDFLADQPWEILCVGDGRQALQVLVDRSPDVAVLDLQMPGLNGLEVLDRAVKRRVSTDIVMVTGCSTVQTAVRALRAGARDFLPKPMDGALLVEKIRSLVQARANTSGVLAERLVAYVRAHAGDPKLSLAALQKHFCISKSYACKLFGGLGTSFTRVLVRARIGKAKRLMASSDDPLYAIAEACGFKQAQRFSEAFQRLVGCAPSQYRNGRGKAGKAPNARVRRLSSVGRLSNVADVRRRTA